MSVSRARYFPIHRPVPPMKAAAAASTPAVTRTPRRDGPADSVIGKGTRVARRSSSHSAPTPVTAVARGGHHVERLGGRPVERGERR